ncbi:MAG: response regulator [Burkholderiaceae bacterium]|nr:response regulator [Burkholderiaceae bacterium]MDP3423086.1 response regulator [Burkholderiaceae bacterium]MDZ4162333.1 response regulator [Burkholderiales bacterium]
MPPSPAASRPLRILVADDNPVNLRVATRVLRDMGHSGVLVTDGEKALKALDAQSFDVALMDVTMPVLDGLSTVAVIRERERAGRKKMPVIMVTAFDLPSDRARMLAAGADGYLAKPLERQALEAELAKVLR